MPETPNDFDWVVNLEAIHPRTGKKIKGRFWGKHIGGVQPWLISAQSGHADAAALFANPFSSPISTLLDGLNDLPGIPAPPQTMVDLASDRFTRTGTIEDMRRAVEITTETAKQTGFLDPDPE